MKCVGITILVLVACTAETVQDQDEIRIDGVSVIVSTESEILSRPADMLVADNGEIHVLDYLAAQVLVLSPSGELLRTIGREGGGPREFSRPRGLVLSGDTLRVVDVGNGRLQTLALDTDFMRTTPLPIGSDMGPIAVNENGWLMAGTLGMHDVLATYHDASGDQLGTLGTPPAQASQIMDFAAMKREIVAGTVPAMFRNAVLPVFAPDGDMWLILTGEGVVERYDSEASLQVSVPLVAPEMEGIWARCVERNRETLNDPRRLAGLSYVTDAVVVDGTLWLLLNAPPDEPSVILALAGDGTVRHRVVFSGVTGAQQFSFERARGRGLGTIPSTAGVVAAPLPAGIL